MASDQEASSSNSSNSNSTRTWKYDVFLSFRGEDTRKGFTNHLYHALHNSGFKVFRDDNELRRGEVISQELLQAIEKSRFALVVLSENYASSSWCLDELQHILALRNKLGQQVIPIFYYVNPSDVRRQRGSFGKALAKLEEKFQVDQQKVQKWRDSLTKVANLSGLDSGQYRYETELIDNVVEHLWDQFRSELPLDGDTLIGIDSRVDKMYIHLGIALNGVRFIGIWGMGGIGKTTLARAIYERFHSQFDFHCFLANVREVSERNGIIHLQRKLLSHSKTLNIEIEDKHEGKNTIRCFFRNRKVILILDDVSHISQLHNLAGSRDWFGEGSRVIITSRDVSLLRSHNVDEIYEVKPMNNDESLQLFCEKAFRRDQPKEGFLELSKSVINYANGLPLALCVLGSFFSGRREIEWKDAFDILKKDSNNDIFKILRLSYDALNCIEKAIFLDIACFFNMWGKDEVIQILASCGLEATIGLSNLIEKSLLAEIELGNDKYIEMHDLVQDMGRLIVFEESHDDVGIRSRLWFPQDIDQVLKRNKGTKATEGVVLPFNFAKNEAYWNPVAFLRMRRLRLLIISSHFNLPRGLEGFPLTLKVLHWYGYPLKDLPFGQKEEKDLSLRAELYELVYLKMQNSKIKRLSLGTQFMENLQFLDLSHSQYLIETPNFFGSRNLRRLILEGCIKLCAIHPSLGQLHDLLEVNLKGCVNVKVLPRQLEMTSLKELVLEDTGIVEAPESLGSLTSVKVLNLRNCRNLKFLPRKLEMNSLKELVLCGCPQVRNLPEFGKNMKNLITLDVQETSIVELPESIGLLTGLQTLNLRDCKNFVGFPHNIHKLKFLKVLNIYGCSTLSKLPENLNEIEALEMLDASETAITEVPSSISHLEEVKTLSFCGCLFPTGLILPDSILNIESLTELDLSYSNIEDGMIPDDLVGLSSLQKLDLSGNMFVNLPTGCIFNLLNLQFLYLNSCLRLQSLPQPSSGIDVMDAGECSSLIILSNEKLLHLFALIYQSGQYAKRLPHRLNDDSLASISVRTFSVTIPGSEIPSWFNNQTYLSLDRKSESSITIDVPASEWIGFVSCAVLDDDMFYSSDAYQSIFCWRYYFAKASDGNLVFLQGKGRKLEKEINSPHLWILFCQIGKQNGSCLSMDYSKLLLKFEAEKNERLHFIKCGWRVLSTIDFESLLSIVDECKDQENARGCEAQEQGNCNFSVSESNRTIVSERETKSPQPSPFLEDEGRLYDSRMQFNTDNARLSNRDIAPPIVNTTIKETAYVVQSPSSSSFHPSESVITQVDLEEKGEAGVTIELDLAGVSGDTGRKKRLIGWLMTEKAVDKDKVISMIRESWNMQEEMDIMELESNAYMFTFEEEEDYLRVLRGRPWSILEFLLNIQQWAKYMVLSDVRFNMSPFWVQFHNIPLEAMTANNLMKMGERIGEVLMVECPIVNGRIIRSFARARINVDLGRPLMTGFWILRPGLPKIWSSMRYERLQSFCYKCGIVGHDSRICNSERKMAVVDPTEPMYGPWLGVGPMTNWDYAIHVFKQEWHEVVGGGEKKICDTNDIQACEEKMQFIIDNASHRDLTPCNASTTIETLCTSVQSPSSNCCQSGTATTQEARICSNDSIDGTQVSTRRQNASRERNHIGDPLVAYATSKAYSPDPKQTNAEKIFKELSQVSGLEEIELLQIYDILTGDERKYESFKPLPPQLRKPWILMQIKKYYS